MPEPAPESQPTNIRTERSPAFSSSVPRAQQTIAEQAVSLVRGLEPRKALTKLASSANKKLGSQPGTANLVNPVQTQAVEQQDNNLAAERIASNPVGVLFGRFDRLRQNPAILQENNIKSADFVRLQELAFRQRQNILVPGEADEMHKLMQSLTAQLDQAESLPHPLPVRPVLAEEPDVALHAEATTSQSVEPAGVVNPPNVETEAVPEPPVQPELVPAAERPQIPKALLTDVKFGADARRFYRQEIQRRQATGAEISDDLDQQIMNASEAKALENYYQSWAEEQYKPEGIPQEIDNDPAYSLIYKQTAREMITQGKTDPAEIEIAALARYKQEKDIQENTPSEPVLPDESKAAAETAAPENQQTAEIADQIKTLLEQNPKFMELLAKTNPQLTELLKKNLLEKNTVAELNNSSFILLFMLLQVIVNGMSQVTK